MAWHARPLDGCSEQLGDVKEVVAEMPLEPEIGVAGEEWFVHSDLVSVGVGPQNEPILHTDWPGGLVSPPP